MGDSDKVKHDTKLEVAIETKLKGIDPSDNTIAEFMDKHGVTGTDSNGKNIAHVLAERVQIAALKALLEEYPEQAYAKDKNDKIPEDYAPQNIRRKLGDMCYDALKDVQINDYIKELTKKSPEKQAEYLRKHPEIAEFRGSNNRSITHVLSKKGNASVLQSVLFEYPNLVLSKDKNRNSPVNYADKYNQQACIDICLGTYAHVLTKRGEDKILAKLFTEYPEMVNYRDKNGLTPIHIAAKENHEKCVKICLQTANQLSSPTSIANMDAGEKRDIIMIVLQALEKNNVNVLDVLLDEYSKPTYSSSEFIEIFGNLGLVDYENKTQYDRLKVNTDFVEVFSYFSSGDASREEKVHFNRMIKSMNEYQGTDISGTSTPVYAFDEQEFASIFRKGLEEAKTDRSSASMFRSSNYSNDYIKVLNALSQNSDTDIHQGFKFFNDYISKHQLFGKEQVPAPATPRPSNQN